MPAQKAEPHNAAKPVVVPVRGQRGQTHVISAALASLEGIGARSDISKVLVEQSHSNTMKTEKQRSKRTLPTMYAATPETSENIKKL